MRSTRPFKRSNKKLTLKKQTSQNYRQPDNQKGKEAKLKRKQTNKQTSKQTNNPRGKQKSTQQQPKKEAIEGSDSFLYTLGAWQGSHWITNLPVSGMSRLGKGTTGNMGMEPRSAAFWADALPLGQRSSWNSGPMIKLALYIIFSFQKYFTQQFSSQLIDD